ncbi:unnamed protein product [Urochloa humidicola]
MAERRAAQRIQPPLADTVACRRSPVPQPLPLGSPVPAAPDDLFFYSRWRLLAELARATEAKCLQPKKEGEGVELALWRRNEQISTAGPQSPRARRLVPARTAPLPPRALPATRLRDWDGDLTPPRLFVRLQVPRPWGCAPSARATRGDHDVESTMVGFARGRLAFRGGWRRASRRSPLWRGHSCRQRAAQRRATAGMGTLSRGGGRRAEERPGGGGGRRGWRRGREEEEAAGNGNAERRRGWEEVGSGEIGDWGSRRCYGFFYSCGWGQLARVEAVLGYSNSYVE